MPYFSTPCAYQDFEQAEEAHDSLRPEARWIVEVFTADGDVFQRLALCDECAEQTFTAMRAEAPQSQTGSYSVLRRFMRSDEVLRFDAVLDGEDEDADAAG